MSCAEVVFNTAMCGYQEALTDPSYTGQILVMTAPLVGNYGVNAEDVESDMVQVAGFVVREAARLASNCRASADLSTYLDEHGVLGLTGVDTRALTRRLRTQGVMRGALTDDATISDADLIERARAAPSMAGQNLVPLVSSTVAAPFGDARGDDGLRVWAIDCGVKRNILRSLADRDCAVTVIPHTTTGGAILEAYAKGVFDGLLVSNGPGDPAAVDATISALRIVLGAPVEQSPPVFGICLGHQILALALGATTYKMPFGHRGVNQPVRFEQTGGIEITSQNHGFAVDAASLGSIGAEATHFNINDGTLAGFRMCDRPVFSVQHHPEACPGPHDATGLFDAFIEAMRSRDRPLARE